MEKCEVLVVRNGVLDLASLYSGGQPVLRPHSDDLFATSRTDYDYDPEATCKKFEKFLDRFTCGRAELGVLLGEIFAYCLLSAMSFQRYFLFLGSGSNAKSVLLHVLRYLVGAAACSAIPLERLGGRFTLSDMLDCRVNIVGDMSTAGKAAEGLLKQLCDGSAVQSEAKFKASYAVQSRTRLVFAANDMIRLLGTTDGDWRRPLLIPCDAKITDKEKISEYEEVLYEESPGILNWALAHAPTLIERGDFIQPECCRKLLRRERTSANSVANWFENCVMVDGSTFVGSTKMLYDHYADWVLARKYIPKATGNFRGELSHLLKVQKDSGVVKYTRGQVKPGGLTPSDAKTMGKTIKGWKGLRILPSLDEGRDDEGGDADEAEEKSCDHDWLVETVNKETLDAPVVWAGAFSRRTCTLCGDVRFERRSQKAIALNRREGPPLPPGRPLTDEQVEELLTKMDD